MPIPINQGQYVRFAIIVERNNSRLVSRSLGGSIPSCLLACIRNGLCIVLLFQDVPGSLQTVGTELPMSLEKYDYTLELRSQFVANRSSERAMDRPRTKDVLYWPTILPSVRA
jgi:hypothetical protein